MNNRGMEVEEGIISQDLQMEGERRSVTTVGE